MEYRQAYLINQEGQKEYWASRDGGATWMQIKRLALREGELRELFKAWDMWLALAKANFLLFPREYVECLGQMVEMCRHCGLEVAAINGVCANCQPVRSEFQEAHAAGVGAF